MTILEALKAVAARDTDHATIWNHIGFSGQDTIFANKLAALDSLSPKQELYAARMVRKYRKQVFAYLSNAGSLKGKALASAIDAFVSGLAWQHSTLDFTRDLPAPEPKSYGKVNAVVGDRTTELKGFVVRFPYNAELVSAIKNLPNRQFKNDPADKRWTVGTTSADIAGLAAMVVRYNLEASEATRKYLGL